MKRLALCVGINAYPRADARLRGCVNDARGVADLLVDVYGFDPAGISVVVDEDATGRRLLEELERLVAGLGKGDIGVFAYSGHGTYVAGDEGGDEVYDEALCPRDMEAGLVLDDHLRQRLDELKAGTRMAVVLDSCFSGSGTRLGRRPTGDRRTKSIIPSTLGLRDLDLHTARPRRSTADPAATPEILLAAARDNQESADDRIDGTFGGAMTTLMIRHLRATRGRTSWSALHRHLLKELDGRGYSQEPQLEGRPGRKRERAFAPPRP